MEKFIVRSSIKPELMRRALFKGSLLAGCGGIILLLGGTLVPVETLKSWGILVFLAGAVLISLGLIPYRKLSFLEIHPHRILFSNDHLEVEMSPKRWHIPIAKITHISPYEKGLKYGIILTLEGKEELRLPYFTKRAFLQLNDWVSESQMS